MSVVHRTKKPKKPVVPNPYQEIISGALFDEFIRTYKGKKKPSQATTAGRYAKKHLSKVMKRFPNISKETAIIVADRAYSKVLVPKWKEHLKAIDHGGIKYNAQKPIKLDSCYKETAFGDIKNND